MKTSQRCPRCGEMAATFFAGAGRGQAWYKCAGSACHRLSLGPAPKPPPGAIGAEKYLEGGRTRLERRERVLLTA